MQSANLKGYDSANRAAISQAAQAYGLLDKQAIRLTYGIFKVFRPKWVLCFLP